VGVIAMTHNDHTELGARTRIATMLVTSNGHPAPSPKHCRGAVSVAAAGDISFTAVATGGDDGSHDIAPWRI
jgi:hypothetical protein